jgi:hypothetical protein
VSDDLSHDDLKPDPEESTTQSLAESTSSQGLDRRTFIALSLGAVPAVSLAATSV